MLFSSGPVLIVDDDAAVRSALRFALEMEGLNVRLYPGVSALLSDPALPAEGCVVVDYSMPGMNGIEMINALRVRHVNLPAILIASYVDRDLRRRAGRAGILHILEKPLSDEALMECIRCALGSQDHLRNSP